MKLITLHIHLNRSQKDTTESTRSQYQNLGKKHKDGGNL